MRYVDDETVWIASFEGESPSLSEIDASLQKSTVKVNRYAVSTYRRETVVVEGTKKSTFVSCLSDDWQTFERCKVISCICVIFGIWKIYPVEHTGDDGQPDSRTVSVLRTGCYAAERQGVCKLSEHADWFRFPVLPSGE